LKPWLLAVRYFNLDIALSYIDGEGFESMQGMNRDLFYHTEDSLRKQGLVEIPKVQYPGPYGGSLYEDNALWRLTIDLSNMEGRNNDPMIIALWDTLSEKFDMADYQPKGEEKNHFLGRAISMQRSFIDAQNIIANAKDQTQKELEMVTERLPRSYEEWVDLQRDLK
jgi:hypothetical protein